MLAPRTESKEQRAGNDEATRLPYATARQASEELMLMLVIEIRDQRPENSSEK